jgi:nucleotide-binding universal stress UspA family protein
MNFKRILVAINHSPSTSIVFDRASDLAQKEHANLTILHCIVDNTVGLEPLLESGVGSGFYPADPEFSQSLYTETLQVEHQAEAWVREYCQKAVALNIPTEYQCHFGDPGITICQVAQKWRADLIVLGRHDDHSAIAELFTGSVSNHVIHHATCSVLVVKEPAPIDTDR